MKIFYLLIAVFFASNIYSQNVPVDTLIVKNDSAAIQKPDTSKNQRVYNPRVAAIRSAILPGLGQIYNRKYWKLPIVYGGLGVCGYVFLDNIKTYREYRFAYKARIAAEASPPDSTGYKQLKPIYKTLSPNTIRAARDDFRRYVDYSALIFLLLWGVNVIDAAVDAHLKAFDVSPDLSLYIKPGYSDMAKTNGVSLVFHIGK